jgi:AcrR family transcriptional regulator
VIKLPKETFSNLPEEKKSKILVAIRNEFARVPFDKVSINKIIKDADISRGSFYMYFEDKEDMLKCILSTYFNDMMSIVNESLRKNQGDLFEVFTDILKFTADFGTSKENIAFCMNIFAYQKVKSDSLMQFSNRCKKEEYVNWFNQNINADNLNVDNSEDVYNIIDILTSVTQKAIVDIFLHINEKDEIIEEYTNKLIILKRGMLKGDF